MKMLNNLKAVLCAGLVGASMLGLGCGKTSDTAVQAAAAPEATAPAPAAPGISEEADPVTRLAYQSGLPSDKVAKILEVYELNAAGKSSGREIYDIALLGSRATGLPTEDVGAVILGYRSLLESGLLKAAAPKPEAPKG